MVKYGSVLLLSTFATLSSKCFTVILDKQISISNKTYINISCYMFYYPKWCLTSKYTTVIIVIVIGT